MTHDEKLPLSVGSALERERERMVRLRESKEMTAPAKPTIDECIADSEADVMLFAQIPEAEKQLAIATANLEFLRNYKRITEAAGRPEPVAWLVQYRDRHEFTFKKPAFLIDAIAEPLYGHGLLDYADRMAAERDEAVNALKAEGIRPKGKSCLPYIIRAETAERQLAEAEKREKSKHEQYTALLERHTKQTERLAELQAKHDALVAMTSAVCEKDPVGCWRVRCHLGKDCAANKELLAAMSAVALDKGGE